MTDTLLIRAPEDDAHVEASLDGTVQQVEKRAAAVRHAEVRRKKRDRKPDTVLRRCDGFGDAAIGGYAIHQRPHRIPCARGIGTRGHARNVSIPDHGPGCSVK
jgi:hypothetical protein